LTNPPTKQTQKKKKKKKQENPPPPQNAFNGNGNLAREWGAPPITKRGRRPVRYGRKRREENIVFSGSRKSGIIISNDSQKKEGLRGVLRDVCITFERNRGCMTSKKKRSNRAPALRKKRLEGAFGSFKRRAGEWRGEKGSKKNISLKLHRTLLSTQMKRTNILNADQLRGGW